MLTSATSSEWAWRKQGEYNGHLTGHVQTLKELKDAARFVKKDEEWYKSMKEGSSEEPTPEYPWLQSRLVVTKVKTDLVADRGSECVGGDDAEVTNSSTKSKLFDTDSP
jgi:hypothetical protein